VIPQYGSAVAALVGSTTPTAAAMTASNSPDLRNIIIYSLFELP
jgi:hypothetical protein